MGFRYATTDIVTGRVLCDDLPLTVSSFSRSLNGAGTLSGTLNLQAGQSAAGGYGVNSKYLTALTPRKAALWVLQDGFPVWCGVVWGWPAMSMSTGQVPIAAATFESIFDHRLITADLAYAGVDMFTVFCDLVTYALTKSSPYIPASSPTPPAPAEVVAAAAVPSIRLPHGQVCGVPWTASYTYSDLQPVSAVWQAMATSGDLEYAFEPGTDPATGESVCFLRLGYLQLGDSPAVSGISLSCPGNVLDYGWEVQADAGGNLVWVTAPPNGSGANWLSQWPHGSDLAELGAGYPLLEVSSQWPGSAVTAQAQVDGYADGQVPLLSNATTVPVITIPATGTYPLLRDITLGDTLTFAATSALHPPGAGGAPGLQAVLRVTGWTCTPSDAGQAATVQLATSTVAAM